MSRLIDVLGGKRREARPEVDKELEQARQTIRTLEKELREARAEIERLKATPKVEVVAPQAAPERNGKAIHVAPPAEAEAAPAEAKAAPEEPKAEPKGKKKAKKAEVAEAAAPAAPAKAAEPPKAEAKAPEAPKAEAKVEAKASTSVADPPRPQGAQEPPKGGLLAAARAAAASGISTSATFRLQAPGEGQHVVAEDIEDEEVAFNGTADPIIGSTAHDSVIRVAADGAKYCGPVDNRSARSRATGETLNIDRHECIGCGTCVEHIDTVFWLNDDEGKAYVLAQDGAMDRIEDAIDACPVTCISWLPEDQLPEGAKGPIPARA